MNKKRCVNCKWYYHGGWCFKSGRSCARIVVCDEWEAC